jgi:hypothetical protein
MRSATEEAAADDQSYNCYKNLADVLMVEYELVRKLPSSCSMRQEPQRNSRPKAYSYVLRQAQFNPVICTEGEIIRTAYILYENMYYRNRCWFNPVNLKYEVWQYSSRTGAATFTLGGGETNYCHLSVVLLLTNTWQGSESPVIDTSWAGTQWV